MLPSFTQTAAAQPGCSWNSSTNTVTCPRPRPGNGCTMFCDDETGYEDYDDGLPEFCSVYEMADLRALRASIPNCNGDPGRTFDVNNWLTENYWALAFNGLTNLDGFVGMVNNLPNWLDYFSDSLNSLAFALNYTNGDLLRSRDDFRDNLWETCNDQYSESEWQTHPDLFLSNSDARICYEASYAIMITYMPDSTDTFFNNVFDAFIPDFVTVLSNSWGSMFSTTASNHYRCHNVYQAWDEENCGGSL